MEGLGLQVAVVTQEPVLFSATILENIRYAKPQATEAEVIQACKDAFIHDTISALPKGYHTEVRQKKRQGRRIK